MKKIFFALFTSVLMIGGCMNSQTQISDNVAVSSASQQNAQNAALTVTSRQTPGQTAPSQQQADPPQKTPATNAQLAEPISNALSRITKKTFGLKVSPGHSPVSPEKFSGYHTGVDFETTPDEQNIDVPIYAACDGKLLMKKIATGYGGVAVQSCTLNGAAVTIIYGHLKYTSIIPSVGQALTAGEKIAVLGKGYSSETSGERKHLHFGVHKGTGINILGYVQVASQLGNWLDGSKYMQ